MSKIKIFVSYKSKRELLKNDIITPIQTGCAITDEIFPDMLQDNVGENISKENLKYNELTAQYWVWKNYDKVDNPEYVGFMHNRRHFIFDKNLKHLFVTWLPNSEFYYVPKVYKNYMEHFTEDKILPYLDEKPDCIIYKKYNVCNCSNLSTNMKSHFKHTLIEQEERFYTTMEAVIKESFPQYISSLEEFTSNSELYCCNSFIMPRHLFFEYSEFLFTVLEKIDKKIDSTNFNEAKLRFLGFLGEYLLTIFILQKLKSSDFKIIELPGTYISKDYKKVMKKFFVSKLLSKLTLGKAKKRYLDKANTYKAYFSTLANNA